MFSGKHDKEEIHLETEEVHLLKAILHELRLIRQESVSPTPNSISFSEITMNPASAGSTQVWTATLSPVGAQFPAGTSYTVTSNYPSENPTVDGTGLIVSITYSPSFVDDPANPFVMSYATSTFVPNPSTSPATLSAVITPSAPAPTTLTPVSVSFAQTT
jgi:hypothetical protein